MPEAGWYDDPADADRRRWWDGDAWTDRTQPAAPRTAPPPPPSQTVAAPSPPPWPRATTFGSTQQQAPTVDDNAYWWMLGILPVGIALAVMLPESMGRIVGYGALGANVGLATVDLQRNPWMEQQRDKWKWLLAAALLVPVYVFMRDTSARSGRWRFWVYLGTFVVSLGLVVTVAVAIDALRGQSVEELEAMLTESLATEDSGEITVDCLATSPPQTGDTLTCNGTEEGSAPFTIEVIVRDDTMDWRVVSTGIVGDELADQIATHLTEVTESRPTVDCPDLDDAPADTEFLCTGVFDDGSSAEVQVTVTEGGGVNWQVVSTSMDGEGLADQITTHLTEIAGSQPTVDCPDLDDAPPDTEFRCTGIFDDGSRVNVQVTVTEGGGINWHVASTGIVGHDLADQIATQLTQMAGSRPTVDCPDLDDAPPDTEFRCTAVFDDGSTVDVQAVVAEGGGVNWHVVQ